MDSDSDSFFVEDYDDGLPAFFHEFDQAVLFSDEEIEPIPYDLLDTVSPLPTCKQEPYTELPEPSLEVTDQMITALESLLENPGPELEGVDFAFLSDIQVKNNENLTDTCFEEPVDDDEVITEGSLFLSVRNTKVEAFTMHEPSGSPSSENRGHKRKADTTIMPDGKYKRKTKTRPPVTAVQMQNLFGKCHGWFRNVGCVPGTVTQPNGRTSGHKHSQCWFVGVERMKKHLKEYHGTELRFKKEVCRISIGTGANTALAERLICLQGEKCADNYTKHLNSSGASCDSFFITRINGKVNYDAQKAYTMHLRTVHNVTQIMTKEER